MWLTILTVILALSPMGNARAFTCAETANSNPVYTGTDGHRFSITDIFSDCDSNASCDGPRKGFSWDEAQNLCTAKGHSLPKMDELKTIYGNPNPINDSYYLIAAYWSSDSDSITPGRYWLLSFVHGESLIYSRGQHAAVVCISRLP